MANAENKRQIQAADPQPERSVQTTVATAAPARSIIVRGRKFSQRRAEQRESSPSAAASLDRIQAREKSVETMLSVEGPYEPGMFSLERQIQENAFRYLNRKASAGNIAMHLECIAPMVQDPHEQMHAHATGYWHRLHELEAAQKLRCVEPLGLSGGNAHGPGPQRQTTSPKPTKQHMLEPPHTTYTSAKKTTHTYNYEHIRHTYSTHHPY